MPWRWRSRDEPWSSREIPHQCQGSCGRVWGDETHMSRGALEKVMWTPSHTLKRWPSRATGLPYILGDAASKACLHSGRHSRQGGNGNRPETCPRDRAGPDPINFPLPGYPPGMDATKVLTGLKSSEDELTRFGYRVHLCFTDLGDTAEAVVQRHLREKRFDCILIRAGIRRCETCVILCGEPPHQPMNPTPRWSLSLPQESSRSHTRPARRGYWQVARPWALAGRWSSPPV
jgi:hypothetical protein